MKHHHIYSMSDPELIIGQILAILSAVPLDVRGRILEELPHRVLVQPETASDQDITVLHEWGVLSTRCYATLTRSLRSSARVSPGQPIRLSDIARLSSAEISTISNMGKHSRIEIFDLLESYGFRLQEPHIIGSLSNIEKFAAREKMSKRMAEQAAVHDRDRALLRELSESGANWQDLALRFGCSERILHNKIEKAARRVAFRDANPLLPP